MVGPKPQAHGTEHNGYPQNSAPQLEKTELRSARWCRTLSPIGDFKIALLHIFDRDFQANARSGHKPKLYESRFVVNLGTNSGLDQPLADWLRLGVILKKCYTHPGHS